MLTMGKLVGEQAGVSCDLDTFADVLRKLPDLQCERIEPRCWAVRRWDLHLLLGFVQALPLGGKLALCFYGTPQDDPEVPWGGYLGPEAEWAYGADGRRTLVKIVCPKDGHEVRISKTDFANRGSFAMPQYMMRRIMDELQRLGAVVPDVATPTAEAQVTTKRVLKTKRDRQADVLKLWEQGLTIAEIAESLQAGVSTISADRAEMVKDGRMET